MNFEWNAKTISIIASIVLLFFGTNIGQYFLIWEPKSEETKASYQQKIDTLNQEIASIGPYVSIWTIRDGPKPIEPGQPIQWEDLEERILPESMVTQSLILDPTSVIGKFYRVGLDPGNPLSKDLVMETPIDDTTREYDIVTNVMPIGLKVGNYIDFRIVYPRGEDYIVLPHKRVEAIHDKTVKVLLNETEIHFYQAVLVDYFLQADKGAFLYLTKYLEPGTQKPATQYYAVPDNILAIMEANPNIAEMINGKMNRIDRTTLEFGAGLVTDDVGSVIASGRNEVSGKISTGESDFTSEMQKLEEIQKQLEQQLELEAQAPQQIVPGDSPGEVSSDVTTDFKPEPAIPIAGILEEGVVE